MEITVSSPFPAWAWPLAWQWIQSFRSRVCDDFAPATCEQFVERMLAARAQTWGIYREGDLGGLIVVDPDSPYRATLHGLFSRSFWGRKTTLTASRAVLREVFAGEVRKLMMFPFADNHQVRALDRALGAVDEGLLRAHTMRGGKPADVVAMSLFKDAFYVAIDQQDHHDQHPDLLGRPERDATQPVGQHRSETGEPGGGLRPDEVGGTGVEQPQL